jgi:hypothetical protein
MRYHAEQQGDCRVSAAVRFCTELLLLPELAYMAAAVDTAAASDWHAHAARYGSAPWFSRGACCIYERLT